MLAVDGAELAVRVGPLVPDPDAVTVQRAHVRVAGEEPEQLVDDRFQVQLLGRQQRELLAIDEKKLLSNGWWALKLIWSTNASLTVGLVMSTVARGMVPA